ncbi:MAG: hypothetical protein R2698_02165 [Microthrixaceae bacterium]
MNKLAAWVKGVFAPDAGAPANQGIYETTEEDGVHAADVYRRGRAITESIARRRGIEPVFYWQPLLVGGALYRRTARMVGPPTIDISGALARHGEVYLDGGHTNEAGARIVAERIWQTLGPKVARRSTHFRTRPRAEPTTTVTTPTTTTTPGELLGRTELAVAGLSSDPCLLDDVVTRFPLLAAATPSELDRLVGVGESWFSWLAGSARSDGRPADADTLDAARPDLAAELRAGFARHGSVRISQMPTLARSDVRAAIAGRIVAVYSGCPAITGDDDSG